MIKFALDATWLRHEVVGGAETYLYNLIKGFMELDDDYNMSLIASKDNVNLFDFARECSKINIVVAPIESADVKKRVLWQNFKLSYFLKRQNISICLEPIYITPLIKCGVQYVSVIHDIQAVHYPQFFSKMKRLWLSWSWWWTVKTAKRVITISNFCKEDIVSHFKFDEQKICAILNAIDVDLDGIPEFEQLSKKYNLTSGEYYYTVSKLNIHKNLDVLVRTWGELRKREKPVPVLVVSGTNGGMAEKLISLANEYGIKDKIVLTGFVEEPERNALYKNAKVFLFPSVFEGFGMPVVEAMICGTTVITTNETSIPEVTQGKANYVKDPYSVEEWIEQVTTVSTNHGTINDLVYQKEYVASQYLKCVGGLIK